MAATGVLTIYGLSALAAAPQGGYVPPIYLVIENSGSALSQAQNAGDTSVSSAAAVHLSGDTQLVVGAGTPAEEVVTFSSVSGSGPAVYTLSTPLTTAHASGDPVCRLPLAADTMAQVVNEIEYDHANDPGQRVQSVGGYSTANGQWTMQFYITGIEASSFIMTIGISDSPLIGQGNLHAHMVVGVDHVYNPDNGGVDIELDVPINLNAA